MKTKVLAILLATFSGNIYAQCIPNYPSVIINEIGNFGTIENQEEYLELLVTPDSEDPYSNRNLEGLIIDDNNYPDVSVGNQPGHIRLGSVFSSIEPGTLILIYSDSSSKIDKANDGLPNSQGVYQLPFSSSEIIKYKGTPNQTSPNYEDGQLSNGKWNNFIPLRNFGDIAQLRTKNGDLLHAIGWSDGELEVFNSPIIFPGPSSNQSLHLDAHIYSNSSGYSFTDIGSPGLPNSDQNNNFIQYLKNVSSTQYTFFTVLQAYEQQGEGFISLHINNGDTSEDRYEIYLNNIIQTNPDDGNTVFNESTYTLGGLVIGDNILRIVNIGNNCSSEKIITITDGSCIDDCQVIVITDPPSYPDCTDGAISLSISGGVPPYSFFWYSYAEEDSTLIYSSESQNIIGLSPGEYNVQIMDSDCNTAEITVHLACEEASRISSVTSEESLKNEFKDDNDLFSIVPNPTTDVIQLSFGKKLNSSIKKVRVFDSNGKVMFVLSTELPQIGIDLGAYPSGIYFIQVVGENSELHKVERVTKL